jgi:hypothetical protein
MRPHWPQFEGLVVTSTQRPLQNVVPGGHAHSLATQETPEGHARPQAPQLAWFAVRSTHPPLQLVVPVKHVLEQAP